MGKRRTYKRRGGASQTDYPFINILYKFLPHVHEINLNSLQEIHDELDTVIRNPTIQNKTRALTALNKIQSTDNEFLNTLLDGARNELVINNITNIRLQSRGGYKKNYKK